MWLQKRVLAMKDGENRWQQLVAQLDAPPVSAARTPAQTGSDSQAATAFDAYERAASRQ